MNKKFNKELSKGGWKAKDKLFETKEDDLSINLLLTKGSVVEAKWNYSKNLVDTDVSDFALWKEKVIEEKRGWFSKLIENMFGGLFAGFSGK